MPADEDYGYSLMNETDGVRRRPGGPLGDVQDKETRSSAFARRRKRGNLVTEDKSKPRIQYTTAGSTVEELYENRFVARRGVATDLDKATYRLTSMCTAEAFRFKRMVQYFMDDNTLPFTVVAHYAHHHVHLQILEEGKRPDETAGPPLTSSDEETRMVRPREMRQPQSPTGARLHSGSERGHHGDAGDVELESAGRLPTLDFLPDAVDDNQVEDGIYARADIFIFKQGTLVTWGLTENEERQLRLIVRRFEREPNTLQEIDEMEYFHNLLTVDEQLTISNDLVRLPTDDSLTKLAISYALAQSVKLSVFEDDIDQLIKDCKHIPRELAQTGKVRSLSRKETSMTMGSLASILFQVNAQSEYLDSYPEFFWDLEDKMEKTYSKMLSYMDVRKRVAAINSRLTVLQDMMTVLREDQTNRHSSFLEWIVIILVAIEVVLGIGTVVIFAVSGEII